MLRFPRPLASSLGLWLLAAVVLATAVGGMGCGDSASSQDATAADSTRSAEDVSEGDDESGDAESDDEASERRATRERSVTVNVAEVVRGDLVLPVIAEGTIRARRVTDIQTEIKGRVSRVLVDEGQRVRAGQTLVRLDAREYRVAYDEARASYLEKLSRLAVEDDLIGTGETESTSAAEEQLEAELAELERQERRGTITRDQRIDREIALRVGALREGAYRRDVVAARSGVAQAQAAMERAQLDLERTELRAAFDGVVTDISLSEGEQVTVNQVVATLVDDVRIEAEVGVLESDLRGLETGRKVLLEIPALGDTVEATLDVLSPRVDPDTRTCQALVRLKGDGRVRPGMYVRAFIAGDIVPDCLVVPREAVLVRDGRPLVFKIAEDRAKWTYVELGQGNDHLVEIASVLRGGTLEPGEQVIVSGHLTLAHDAKIRVRRTITPEDPWKQ